MALPEFVTRRGERLYYRRAYPKELWPVTGRQAFALSLHTSDPKEALRARPEAERRYCARVDAARAELVGGANRKPLTKADAESIAVRWFFELLDTAEDFMPRVQGPDELAGALEDAEWALAEARRALAEGGRLSDSKRLAKCLREEAGLGEDAIAEATLVRLVGRAAVAAEEVYSGRLSGDYGARPSDPLFASAMKAGRPRAAAAATPGVVVAKAVPTVSITHLEETFRKVKFPALSPATQQGYEPVFRLLREVLGAETSLAGLTHDDGLRLFQAAQQMPTNAEKRRELKGRPIPEQIAEAKRMGLPTLAPKTINDRYMANLSALFSFARQRDWMERNPVVGLRAKEEVAAADKREPFGPRLRNLLRSAPWTPRDVSAGGKPIRYWGPLLALYHGLRLGEVAGLEVRDVADENGQPMLLIRTGKRRLKTEAARRDIPVHSELIRLGFLGYVEARKRGAKPDEMLFPSQKAFAREQWGRGLGEWFAKRVRELELEGRKLTFHALRHDFRDALREAEVDRALADYVMGHASEGVGAIYGGRPSLARLKAAIEAVAYPVALPS